MARWTSCLAGFVGACTRAVREGLLALICIAAVLCSAGYARAAGPSEPPLDCAASPIEKLTPLIMQEGPTPAAAQTMILPANGGARMLFRQTMATSAAARSYRVFEVSAINPRGMTGWELPIVSIDPAEAAYSGGLFKPTDSMSLLVHVTPLMPPWLIRSFAIVSCNGKSLEAWGGVTAPVSHPLINLAICVLIGLAAYGLGMSAVFRARSQPIPGNLATKYPAVFAQRLLTVADFFNPIHLVADMFNRGSVQKFQVVLFSFLIGEMVLAFVLGTGALVDLSPTIIGLLGISGIGAATAQVAYQQKMRLSFENWTWLQTRKAIVTPEPSTAGGPYWRDLVMTNREFDVYKLQTIIFSIAVASAIIVAGASHLATFSIPETLLGVLGLSQVVYVGGVLVRPAAVGDLDQAITDLRQAAERLAAARTQKLDTDQNSKLLDALPVGQAPAVNAARQYDEQADRVETMIESTLEVPVNRQALDFQPKIAAGTTSAGTSSAATNPTATVPTGLAPAVTIPAVPIPGAPTPTAPASPPPAPPASGGDPGSAGFSEP